MARALAVLAVVLAAAALVVASLAYRDVRAYQDVRRTLDAVEPTVTPLHGEVLQKRIEGIEARLAAGPASATDDPVARAALDAPPPEEGLRTLVRQVVQEEAEARRKDEEAAAAAAPKEKAKDARFGEGKRPPLTQVVAELDLDAAQKDAVREAVLRGQEETISILRQPTPTGRVPLDDLLKVLMGPAEGQQERLVEVFGMLASEKVPGSGETYAERVEKVKGATAEAFRRSFSAEQFKAWERLGQDPLEIQVPDSPWIRVLQEAWKKK
jgi:hypothetical protein